ncbi:MAG: hypothetical protein FJZ96_06345 [Chloroflexi bacterium]|nr:hypothetical protein [Chloroflexota bacterium]
MYLQEILEVAVGLVFMWMIISLAVMQFQEWLTLIFKTRSTNLKSTIRKMLADPAWAEALYNHPIIKSLSRQPGGWDRFWMGFGNFFRQLFGSTKKTDHSPSYIPANDFALALFDMVVEAGTDASPVRKALADLETVLDESVTGTATWKEMVEVILDDGRILIDAIANSGMGQEAIDALKNRITTEVIVKFPAPVQEAIKGQALPLIEAYFRDLIREQKEQEANKPASGEKVAHLNRLRLGLVALKQTNPKLYQSLRALLSGAEEYVSEKEQALAVVRKNAEKWFDDTMDRLSGWYKRTSQVWSVIIGLVLAVFLNVDTINAATTLWREPTLRQAIVQQGVAYVETNPAPEPEGSAGETALPAAGDTTAPDATRGEDVQPPAQTVAELQESLEGLKIPFGWDLVTYPYLTITRDDNTVVSGYDLDLDQTIDQDDLSVDQSLPCRDVFAGRYSLMIIKSKSGCSVITNLPVDASSWLYKIIGILITALAAAQGAPFWFDILKKLINVRFSGPNPAEKKSI